MRDLYSDLAVVPAIAPAVKTAGENGAAIDLQGFSSAVVVVNTGAIVSAGDFSFKLQESDTTTSGDFTDVAAANLLGEAPATMEAASAYRVGYTGGAKYIRVVITYASGTSIAAGAVVVKGHPAVAPVA